MTREERIAMRRKNRKERLEVQKYRSTLEGIRSFAGRVRQVIQDKGPIKRSRIAFYLEVEDAKARNRLSSALRDLVRAGHVERIEEGIYTSGPKSTINPKEKRNVMWRILRAKRVLTASDLEEMAEVSRGYALEWLRNLAKLEVVRALDNGKFRLIKDTVQMPDLTDNAEKLRDLRARQKAISKAVTKAKTALDEAMTLMAGEV